jgi:transcriptional regulator with XRE-family HTH domain
MSFNYFYPEEPQTFGETLRKARMDAGATAKELAEALGVTECTVYNWETRGMRPSRHNLEKLKLIVHGI